MPATNVRTVKTDIDGQFVEIAWDDPATNVATYRWFTLQADGVTWLETPFTFRFAAAPPTDGSPRGYAVVPGGKPLRVQQKLTTGSQYPTDFTSDAATPPIVLTAEQHLEAALGVALGAGDKVAVYANPSTVKTVNADGSLA